MPTGWRLASGALRPQIVISKGGREGADGPISSALRWLRLRPLPVISRMYETSPLSPLPHGRGGRQRRGSDATLRKSFRRRSALSTSERGYRRNHSEAISEDHSAVGIGKGTVLRSPDYTRWRAPSRFRLE